MSQTDNEIDPDSLTLPEQNICSGCAQDQTFADMEMLGSVPGDDLAGSNGGDAPVMLISIAPDVPIVRRHGNCHRRLQLLGSDGRSRYFTVQMGQTFLSTPGAPLIPPWLPACAPVP